MRRRRSDYGSIKVSERDIELLYLVGEQYAVTLPQLARLIGRSFHTARALRDRWRRVRSRPVGLNHPAAIAYRGALYVLGGYTAHGALGIDGINAPATDMVCLGETSM